MTRTSLIAAVLLGLSMISPAAAGDAEVCDSPSDNQSAIDACTREIRRIGQGSELADPYYRRGMKYRNNRSYEKSIGDFSAAIRWRPQWSWPFVARGHVYAWQKKFDLALADQETAIRLEPSHVTYVGRAMDLIEAGNIDGAIEDLKQALTYNNDYYYAHLNLGNAYMRQQSWQQALAAYERAVEVAPEGGGDHARQGAERARARLGR